MEKKVGGEYFAGARGEIRTPDLLVRSQTLYPTELRAHAYPEQTTKQGQKLQVPELHGSLGWAKSSIQTFNQSLRSLRGKAEDIFA